VGAHHIQLLPRDWIIVKGHFISPNASLHPQIRSGFFDALNKKRDEWLMPQRPPGTVL
jgi:hypothetical protein